LAQVHESLESTPHLYLALGMAERTDLIEGVVYDVAPNNEPHILAVARLVKALNRGLDDKYIRSCPKPIAVAG
jgi:hypothetical protein